MNAMDEESTALVLAVLLCAACVLWAISDQGFTVDAIATGIVLVPFVALALWLGLEVIMVPLLGLVGLVFILAELCVIWFYWFRALLQAIARRSR